MRLAICVLACATGALSLSVGAPIVVLGPGSLDMRLLTAKLAARAGLKTSLFAASGTAQDIWLEQMYGIEEPSTDPSKSSEPLRAAMTAESSAREAALANAEAIALISDGVPMPEAALSSVLAASPELKTIVCMSRMGVTRATAGPLGFGKEDVECLEAEQRLAAACASGGIELSIVRVGTLKGGGPGRKEGQDVGLARPYYDNVMDIETLRVTQAYDKVTLGAKCTPGDTIETANAFQKALRKGSFEPHDDETSRVVACAAAVAALQHGAPLDFSVGSAKGEAAPTSGQWEAILNAL